MCTLVMESDMSKSLSTYLNDHLAGSTAALEILDNLIAHAPNEEQREFFSALKADVSTDRDTLQALITKLGEEPGTLHKFSGWAAGKVSRLKFTIEHLTDGALGRLEALEMLVLGIQGKAALWRALERAAPQMPALQPANFAHLEARAMEQFARVERRRVEAALEALTTT
jgi:hypothetical protein